METTDPHPHSHGRRRTLSRRSMLKTTAGALGGIGALGAAGVALAPAASALTGHNEISGQKLHYYNGSVDNNRAATTFQFNETTYLQAERALEFYYSNSPGSWLKPMHLWLDGVYVDKPGMHGSGRAIDVSYIYMTVSGSISQTFNADWYWWRNQSNMSTYRKRYWGYVASLNRYFNPVLHYWYTPDNFSGAADYSHQRHVHYDDGTSGPGTLATFRASSSRNVQNYAVQSILTYIWGISVGIDGEYGPQTEAATRTALSRIGYSGLLTNATNWNAFLAESCRAGTGLYTPSLATFTKAEAAKAKG
jgi:peptidoglycan hydrolase-like protein with peptidoglycan-binding domain